MRRQAMAVAVLGCALVAAGCTGSDPAPSNTTTSSSTTTPMPSTTTSPSSPTGTTTSADALPSDVPAVARQHSRAGAIAMARYFVSASDAAFRTNDSTAIAAISSTDCVGCQGIVTNVNTNKSKGYHQSGESMTVAGVLPRPVPTDTVNQQIVDLLIDSKGTNTVDQSGKVVDSTKAHKWTLRVLLSWKGGAWSVDSAGQVNL